MNAMKRALAMPWVPPSVGKAPYLWAFSLLFLFWKYLLVAPSLLETVALLLTVALFLPMYFASFWAAPPALLLLIVTTCLLGALWAPYNFSASTFFIFAAGMCSGISPARRAYQALGGVMLVVLAVGAALKGATLAFWLPALTIGLPVGIAAIMETSLRRSRE
jgi:two-component system sensor histidine kinase DesK